MNKIDREICEDIANRWLYLGGDADGFNWLMGNILEMLRDIESGGSTEDSE